MKASAWVGGAIALVSTVALASVASALVAPPTPEPDPVVSEWPSWPYQAACYGPPFDPVSVFSAPANAELGSSPAEVALREAIQNPALAVVGMSRNGWRLVSESETQGVFVTGPLLPVPWWAMFERGVDSWKWSGSGTCTPRTVLHGLGAVSWTLAVDQRVIGVETRYIRVNLGSGPCSSGMSQNARARKPIFRQIGKKLLMTILLDPLPPGAYTCQGVIDPPLTLKLPGRLGRRKLFDAGTYPPGDVIGLWHEARRRLGPDRGH